MIEGRLARLRARLMADRQDYLRQLIAQLDVVLPEHRAVLSALEKARDNKTLIGVGKHVGHLRRDDFTTLRDWCRAMRLGSDAAAVEVALTAAPE